MKMVKKMKKLITIFGIAALLLVGCSNPVENSLEPITPASGSISKEMGNGTDSPTALPSELYVEQEIDGGIGGKVTLEGLYLNYYGDSVTVKATLTIPAGAYKRSKLISIRTDSHLPVIEFEPGGEFDSPIKLDLKFTGMRLERYGLQNGKTDFYYIADDGTQILIKNDGLNVNLAEKKAEVRGAKLNHFSRYGFIRKLVNQCSNSVK
jgi:hypothetical protein